MIRLICKESDGELLGCIGGPLKETCKTFLISHPELQAWLEKKDVTATKKTWIDRVFIGIEVTE